MSIVNYDTSYQDSLLARHSSSKLDSALAALRNYQLSINLRLPHAVEVAILIYGDGLTAAYADNSFGLALVRKVDTDAAILGLYIDEADVVGELGSERRETVRSLSIVGVGNLRGSDTSTRGPCWTDLWFAGCTARCTAGYPRLDRISAESI